MIPLHQLKLKTSGLMDQFILFLGQVLRQILFHVINARLLHKTQGRKHHTPPVTALGVADLDTQRFLPARRQGDASIVFRGKFRLSHHHLKLLAAARRPQRAAGHIGDLGKMFNNVGFGFFLSI